jgi:hypothetical protein
MHALTRFGGALGVALALVSAVGCSEAGGDGAVTVSWSLGGTTCNQSGISSMTITLYATGDAVLSAQAPCVDGEVRIDGVVAGTYTVEVAAFKTGEADPAYVGRVGGVNIPKGGVVAAPRVELEQAPGAIDLSWRFDDGRLCRFAGVKWLSVGIFDAFGRKAMARELACDPEAPATPASAGDGESYLEAAKGVVFEPLLPGSYTISLFGRAEKSDAAPQFYGNGDAVVTVYGVTPVDIALLPCPTGADSPCR